MSKAYKTLADMVLVTDEVNPKAKLELPKIPPSEIYKHKGKFGLKASTFYFESHFVPSIPSSSTSLLFVNLKNPKLNLKDLTL